MAFDVVRQVIRPRLHNQRLLGSTFAGLAEAVAWFGAVQAQDYRGALWGLGQRIKGATEADLEAALAAGEVIRTWPMRGTLHFVAADDARWMTRLLAPRIIRRAASRYRELGLDAKTFGRGRECLEKALAGGQSVTRPEAYAALTRGKVSPAGQRGPHILGRLAMDGVLCIAAPRGKQQTIALLDEWVPRSRDLDGDAALAELARRYITSHGPATVEDLAWWSGLTLTETRRALELAGDAIELVGALWRSSTQPVASRVALGVQLLPAYDEYTVAYRDRSAFLDPADRTRGKNGIFAPVVVVDGRIAGTWGRTAKTSSVTIKPKLWHRTSAEIMRGIEIAVRRYGGSVGLPTTLAR